MESYEEKVTFGIRGGGKPLLRHTAKNAQMCTHNRVVSGVLPYFFLSSLLTAPDRLVPEIDRLAERS